MSPKALLESVTKRFPELLDLPKKNLRVVAKALVYATTIVSHEDLLTERAHEDLLEKLGGRGGITPANSLKAYRLRIDLTQEDLAKKSGISQANISAMEKGRRPIGLRVAKKLAEILSCDYKKLI